jgi:hypothetical protein
MRPLCFPLGGLLNNYGLECWRLSQQAVFGMILSTQETASISLGDMLLRLTQVFRFAAKLAKITTANADAAITVTLADICGRPLLTERSIGRYQYSTADPELSHSWRCSREELSDPDKLAVKAAFWLCERFNCPITTDSLDIEQKRILSTCRLSQQPED